MPTPRAFESDLRAEWENSTPADPGTPANALRALRRLYDLSRGDLAKASGLKLGRIADMESGKRRISPEVATILARVFRTVPSLFG
jgi:transcriptional regulator with XRE-family HTH domain